MDPNPTDEEIDGKSAQMEGGFTISRDCYWRSMSSKRNFRKLKMTEISGFAQKNTEGMQEQ